MPAFPAGSDQQCSLQNVMHCITLHYIADALHYITMQCIALLHNEIQCIALNYITMQCIALHYNAIQCTAVMRLPVKIS